MGKRFGWLRAGGALLVAALGCVGEVVTAPDACPAYCASTGITPRDTVFLAAISRDSSHRGYQTANSAQQILVAGTAGAREARAIVKFFSFPLRYQILPTDTTTSVIQSVDSLRINVSLRKRTTGTVELAVYRLPRATDTLVTYDAATPFFQDSTKVAQITVSPDTGLVQIAIPASALPTLEADSFEVALGVAVVTPTANLRLGSNEAGFGMFVERFIQVDSATIRVTKSDRRLAQFDTFIFQDLPAPATGAMFVGGAPAARALMKLTLPSRIVDSTNVVRATLLLIPSGPVLAAADDTLRLLVHALAADIGPKSPVAIATGDDEPRAGAFVAPNTADTIRIDITNLIRLWKSNTELPRTFVIRAVPDAGTLSEIRFWSSQDAMRHPLVQVTYVPPFGFGVP